MGFDVTVVVPTWGDSCWVDFARDRAIPSAMAQGVPVIHHHGSAMLDAFNAPLAEIETEWMIMLGADDELAPGYVTAMAAASADVRAPSIRYVWEGEGALRTLQTPPRFPGHIHRCEASCLRFGNWVACGAAVRTDLARELEGWRAWPTLEDWEFWLRCWQAGATFEPVDNAVYIAYCYEESRSRSMVGKAEDRIYEAIRQAHPWAGIAPRG